MGCGLKLYCAGLLLKRLLNLLSYVGDRYVVPEAKPGQDHQRNNPVEECFFGNRQFPLRLTPSKRSEPPRRFVRCSPASESTGFFS